jgi:hypothetical protein
MIPEPITPVAPVVSAELQQAPGSPATTTQVPAGYVEQARLTGALQKIEQLTLTNRILADASIAKDATIGQLQAELVTGKAATTASVGEHSVTITNLTKERDDLKVQVALSEATKNKIKFINEAGRPELFAILDSIPNVADEAAQKKIIADLGNFAVNIAKQRETQLVAGVIPVITDPSHSLPPSPKSDAEWSTYLNTLTLGSIERQKAMDQYFEWTRTPRTP